MPYFDFLFDFDLNFLLEVCWKLVWRRHIIFEVGVAVHTAEFGKSLDGLRMGASPMRTHKNLMRNDQPGGALWFFYA